MTPDEVYLRHILDALVRISAYTKDGREEFMENPMIQDATVRNLEIVGEATKNVSREFRDRHPEVSWRYCQKLWINPDHAASFSSTLSANSPSTHSAPALTNATK